MSQKLRHRFLPEQPGVWCHNQHQKRSARSKKRCREFDHLVSVYVTCHPAVVLTSLVQSVTEDCPENLDTNFIRLWIGLKTKRREYGGIEGSQSGQRGIYGGRAGDGVAGGGGSPETLLILKRDYCKKIYYQTQWEEYVKSCTLTRIRNVLHLSENSKNLNSEAHV